MDGAGRRVLITGGGGFLGAWIVRRLCALGFSVRVFDLGDDRQLLESIAGNTAHDIDWVCGDVSDSGAMLAAAEGCSGMIHLAGLLTTACQDDPLAGARVNVLGTLNAFESARAHAIDSVTYMSSGGVYGPADGITPCPTTHYGAYKLANEGNARAYWEDARISSVGLRPFVVYGPGRESGLTAGITIACRAAARGSAYSLSFCGRVGLVHVDDVAAACVSALLQKPVGVRTVNLTGQVTTVEAAVEIIRELVPGADINVDGPPIPSAADAVNEWTSCGLDLPDERSLRSGLQHTIDFYRRESASGAISSSE